MQFQTLEPATHAYSFWEGIPLEGRAAFGRLFAASRSLRGVVVVQRAMRGDEPAAVMADLGFGPGRSWGAGPAHKQVVGWSGQ